MNRRLLAIIVLLLPATAAAHAMLEHAEPSAGAQLNVSPKQLHLDFSEPLEPAFSGLSITDSGGHSVANGAPVISGTTMTISLKTIPSGSYRVQWHAVSVDTHRTEGRYSFTVGP
ncbi:MAG TPA: copper homeostasis periplasmic binding protein CopC [Rhizomicrobium sp.]|nr:copper homeostasis periplasmic binding protein CopC [Rhizomicrobium sp.]